MTIRHHPNDETLLRHAAGTLAAGLRLVVSVHLASCPACRSHVARLEAVGGMLLDETDPVAMEPGAFVKLMARIDTAPAGTQQSSPPVQRLTDQLTAPAALKGCRIGPWRWLGPGRQWSRVILPEEPGALVILLRVGAGRRLPAHTHQGIELTQVLYGSFSDERGRYSAGDLDEADEEVHHRPVVDPGSECVCLAALEAGIRLEGGFGRLIQRVVGF
jgi:putative transcriptional regulator